MALPIDTPTSRAGVIARYEGGWGGRGGDNGSDQQISSEFREPPKYIFAIWEPPQNIFFLESGSNREAFWEKLGAIEKPVVSKIRRGVFPEQLKLMFRSVVSETTLFFAIRKGLDIYGAALQVPSFTAGQLAIFNKTLPFSGGKATVGPSPKTKMLL